MLVCIGSVFQRTWALFCSPVYLDKRVKGGVKTPAGVQKREHGVCCPASRRPRLRAPGAGGLRRAFRDTVCPKRTREEDRDALSQ